MLHAPSNMLVYLKDWCAWWLLAASRPQQYAVYLRDWCVCAWWLPACFTPPATCCVSQGLVCACLVVACLLHAPSNMLCISRTGVCVLGGCLLSSHPQQHAVYLRCAWWLLACFTPPATCCVSQGLVCLVVACLLHTPSNMLCISGTGVLGGCLLASHPQQHAVYLRDWCAWWLLACFTPPATCCVSQGLVCVCTWWLLACFTPPATCRVSQGLVCLVVACLLHTPSNMLCVSGTGLLGQVYVLPHRDRSRGSNFLSHPVTVY